MLVHLSIPEDMRTGVDLDYRAVVGSVPGTAVPAAAATTLVPTDTVVDGDSPKSTPPWPPGRKLPYRPSAVQS
jgi:hypothetical protein